MIVCSCMWVSDREVRAAVNAGARTVEDITAACGAGAKCASCEPTLCALLRERHDASSGRADLVGAQRAG